MKKYIAGIVLVCGFLVSPIQVEAQTITLVEPGKVYSEAEKAEIRAILIQLIQLLQALLEAKINAESVVLPVVEALPSPVVMDTPTATQEPVKAEPKVDIRLLVRRTYNNNEVEVRTSSDVELELSDRWIETVSASITTGNKDKTISPFTCTKIGDWSGNIDPYDQVIENIPVSGPRMKIGIMCGGSSDMASIRVK